VWPISHHTGEAITSLHALSPSRVITLRNCLDPLQTLAPVTPPPAGPPRFLSVSRLSYGDRYKGVDRTIEAFARARGRLPEGSTLEIVGDGDDRARLSQLSHAEGISDAVIFHGSVSDQRLDGLLQACRALVLPSLQEGFGLVFVEAMARGRAVIAARAAATPEVVRDGVTGLLVEPADAVGLAEALVRLGGDVALSCGLGVAGRKRVEEAFLFPRYAREVAARLDALTES
jgi:glycosyltransferase involved in cell wall biosynthesis